MSYQRNISHCEKSPYVRFVTISRKSEAENADTLEIVHFKEVGWRVVVTKNVYDIGEQVFFIPVDSVLPTELVDIMGIGNYLSKGRVRAAKIRGNISEGLIVNHSIVQPYIDAIMKWEDLPSSDMGGQVMSPSDINPRFVNFYKMPNLMNDVEIFMPGDILFYSEKIHGTNGRAAILPHPQTGLPTYYIGGHYQTFKDVKENDNVLYRKVACQVFGTGGERLLPDHVFFFEVYGYKVQQIHYGLSKQALKVFAIYNCEDHKYLHPITVSDICSAQGIPCVDFHTCVYTTVDDMMNIANSPSIMYDGVREGIVMISDDDPCKMSKLIGINYLSKNNRKERH